MTKSISNDQLRITNMKDNVLQNKSYQFALKLVAMYKQIVTDKKEFVLSKQVLRSGTVIGAIIEEAIGGQSQKDFISKLAMAYKEARETRYWLSLLRDSGYLEKDLAGKLLIDCEELCKIIGAIQITMKNKIDNS